MAPEALIEDDIPVIDAVMVEAAWATGQYAAWLDSLDDGSCDFR